MRRGDGISFSILPFDFDYGAASWVGNLYAVAGSFKTVMVTAFYGEGLSPETVNAFVVTCFGNEEFFALVVAELRSVFRQRSARHPAFGSAFGRIEKSVLLIGCLQCAQ